MSTASWNTNWSKNFFSPNYYAGVANNYALMPLAVPEQTTDRTKMFTLIPQLAQSWDINDTARTVTIHLRTDAKWDNGQPVTSKDLMDWFLLSAVNAQQIFQQDIQNLSAPSTHEFIVTFNANVANINERGYIAAMTPIPDSVYGKLMPAGLQKDVLTYTALQNTNPAAAAKSPSYQVIKQVLQKLQAFEPSTFVGDGPFRIVRTTTAESQLVKSKTFYGAAKIHPSGVSMVNTLSSSISNGIFPKLLSHRVDWYNGSAPATIFDRWKHASDAGYATAPNDIQFELYFNNRRYPFSMVQVRQAIAYVIDRKTLLDEEGGGSTVSKWVRYPYGMTESVGPIWITKAQLQSLNPYTHNPTKAAELLTSLHFVRKSGHWIMPNGKPFTTTVIAPSSPTDAVVAAKTAASMLTAFGISATASAIDTTGYTQKIEKGDFDIEWNTGMGGNLQPVCGIDTALGAPNNFGGAPLYTGDPGIGFGPEAVVPGLGKVNIPNTVADQCQHTNAGPRLAELAWDWAQLVNQQLPYLSYGDNYLVDYYSTSHYNNWPPKDNSLWPETGLYSASALVMMMEQGYIRPRG